MDDMRIIEEVQNRIRDFATGTGYVINRELLYDFLKIQELDFSLKRYHVDLAWKELIEDGHLVAVGTYEPKDIRKYKWEI